MPQDLSDPTESLIGQFATGSLHHGLLFLGQRLQSIESQAMNLTRSVLGMSEEQNMHPDLFHLRPSGKARIITVEKTRELISELNRSSNQGGGKVALIHEADRMRKEAANAFLKTLEEPPSGTYLILMTTRPYSMLATIRSRCLLVRLKGEPDMKTSEDWQEWLVAYESWVHSLLDRESLKKDRVSPVFAAYGLTAGLLKIIREQADQECAKVLQEQPQELEEKEKDALESGIRKGVRSDLLKQLAQKTRDIAIQSSKKEEELGKNGIKLAKVLASLEKNTGLLEVNLKDEAALENFYLSSLRIWSSR